MTPDPEHILWSSRSTVKIQDLLIKNRLTWQGGRRRDWVLLTHTAVDYQFLNVTVLTNTLILNVCVVLTVPVLGWFWLCRVYMVAPSAGQGKHCSDANLFFTLELCPNSEAGSSEERGPQQPD